MELFSSLTEEKQDLVINLLEVCEQCVSNRANQTST